MASEKTKKIWMTIGIGLGIILITAFLTSQIIFPLIFRTPKNVEVPNVVGLSLPMAKLRLTQLGLHVVVKDSVWSETGQPNTILDQDPQPGKKIKPESTVYVKVNRGPMRVGVPYLVGLNYSDAYYTLKSAGLEAVIADSLYSDNYPRNTIVRSSPPQGTKVEKGAKVKLYISKGPKPFIEETVIWDSLLM